MGLLVSDIVGIADQRTERRASSKLNLPLEYFIGLQDMFLEQHFWWLRRSASFSTTIGVQAYDLSQPIGSANPVAPDLSEIIGVYRFDATGTKVDLSLLPVLDEKIQEQSMESQTQQEITRFFISPGSTQTLMLGDPADSVRLMRVAYWAALLVDTSVPIESQEVPMIPFWLQGGSAIVLERAIYRFLYGQEDPRFSVAEQLYQDYVNKAARRPSWTVQQGIENRMSSHAVRSHR